MASDQGNPDIDVKRFFFREVEIANEAFRVDIFGAEQKELTLFYYMSHVVIGTIATVANIDILTSFENLMAVNHVAESAKFIFVMNRLDQGIRISVCCEIIKSIKMHTVDPSDGVTG